MKNTLFKLFLGLVLLNGQIVHSEQALTQYDAKCLAEKTAQCVTDAKKKYSHLYIDLVTRAGNKKYIEGICRVNTNQDDFSYEISQTANENLYSVLGARISSENRSDLCNGNRFSGPERIKLEGFSLDSTSCKFQCKNYSSPMDFQQLCYFAALSRPKEHPYSCVVDFEIPDVEFQEEGFVLALNKIAEEVKGLGRTDLQPDPTTVLTCPNGQSSVHFAKDTQALPLSTFANWIDNQLDADNSDRVPRLELEEELRMKINEKDGSFITVQYFDESHEDDAFDWHRFAQTAFAREVRVQRVWKDFSNHDPFDPKTIEIVVPENVELERNPYILTCEQ